MTSDRLPAYSPSRAAGDLIFVSGQLGLSSDGATDVREQTRVALESVRAQLTPHGVDAGDIVKCTVFLADMSDWNEMNDAFGEFFEEPLPARSTVGAALARGALVEIEAVAIRRGG